MHVPALLALALGGAAAAPPVVADPVAVARAWRGAEASRILHEFFDFLALPNTSGDPAGLRRNAEWIADALARRGVETEIWTLDGAAPLVYGELLVPGGRRTLGLYAHYDGQPVDRPRWRHDPWQPVLYSRSFETGGGVLPPPAAGDDPDPESRLYARSAADDKAAIISILAALDALDAADAEPSVNLRFLFEGEEESGSTHLGEYFDRHAGRLGADLWLICDGPVHQNRRPQLVFGVRGYAGLDITVYGATRYLHSGHYGNWAPNPALLLAELLAGMKSSSGQVLVRGFYDGTAPIDARDRAALDRLPTYDTELRHELGLHSTEANNSPLAERLLLPSLNIRGLASAAVGSAARNIIPAEARASLDVRLAEGNDPEVILDRIEEHILDAGFWIVREEPDLDTRRARPRVARVVRRDGYRAVRTPFDDPGIAAVIDAVRRAADDEPLLVPTMGGSLPLYLFVDKLRAPVVITPVVNHDNNQHAPNENLRLANLWFGIDLMTALFTSDGAGATP